MYERLLDVFDEDKDKKLLEDLCLAANVARYGIKADKERLKPSDVKEKVRSLQRHLDRLPTTVRSAIGGKEVDWFSQLLEQTDYSGPRIHYCRKVLVTLVKFAFIDNGYSPTPNKDGDFVEVLKIIADEVGLKIDPYQTAREYLES